jgi:uncharacterized protein
LKPLGCGVVFVPELLPLIREAGDLVSVVEIEPQTLWRRRNDPERRIVLDEAALDAILSLPQGKIAHGIGMPLSGTVEPPEPDQKLLAHTLNELRPLWFSEHLSFNRTFADPSTRFAGFLLPPPQTEDCVALAAENIVRVSKRTGLPVAFETGVNYLRPSEHEMRDGKFFAEVAKRADCGILLDLCNLWVNERNNRQPWRSVLADLPRERVWEIHLAGGSMLDGMHLDSHSGLISDAVLDALEETVNQLPNLGALIFEILPNYIPRVGLDSISRQLERLGMIWNRRSGASGLGSEISPASNPAVAVNVHECTSVWERCLAERIRDNFSDPDPGIGIYRRLIADARSAAVAQCLQATVRLLFLTLGAEQCEALMEDYLHETEAQQFPDDEALGFCEFLLKRELKLPYLEDVLTFERAAVLAAQGSERSIVRFRHDPELLFGKLMEGQLPVGLQPLDVPAEVCIETRFSK